MTTDRICVGAISGSFGVQGEVRLKSFCADPEAMADYGRIAGAGASPEHRCTDRLRPSTLRASGRRGI